IIIPAGTRLSSKGYATAMLRSAVWRGGERVHELAVDGTGFSGDFTPSGTSVYELGLVTGEGAPLGGDTIRLPVRVVPDSAPVIELPVPGTDTIAPLSMRLGLVIDARDDPGLTSIAIDTPRSGSSAQAPGRLPVARSAGRTARAILSCQLGRSGTGLSAGDTLFSRARAISNSPGRRPGRSREYAARIPTGSEFRVDEPGAT